MKVWSDFLSKGEALAKQMTSQAAALADKAKQEEWIKQITNTVVEVRIVLCLFSTFHRQRRLSRQSITKP